MGIAIYIILYVIAFTLPGLAITWLVGVERPKYLMVVGVSYTVMVILVAAEKYAGLTREGIGILTAVIYALSAVVVLWSQFVCHENGVNKGTQQTRNRWNPVILARTSVRRGIPLGIAAPVLVIVAVALYLLWVGPYLEIPSDAWWHIEQFRAEYRNIVSGNIVSIGGIAGMMDKVNRYWYFIHAYLCYLSGINIKASLMPVTILNSTLFLLGGYYFSFSLFRSFRLRRNTRYAIGLFSAFFLLMHFGLNVFSYVRYYVFAPTMANFVVYMAAIGLIGGYLEGKESLKRLVLLVPFMVVAMVLAHKQEALFTIIITAIMVGILFVRRNKKLFKSLCRNNAGGNGGARSGWWRDKINIYAVLIILGYVAIHAYSLITITRHNPLEYRQLVPLEVLLPFLRNLYILDPTYKFYHVVTLWGVLVYVVFFWKYREFSKSTYLVAGMLSPFVTVFNPIFTDFFLRYSWPEVLWRMCYMIPIAFVGAYIAGTKLQTLRARHICIKVASAAWLLLLLILLFPVHSRYLNTNDSRIFTLRAVKKDNDYRIWGDMYRYLDTLKPTTIITDPVTGYTINALTDHRYPGYKFNGLGAPDLTKTEIDKRFLTLYNNSILIINQRDGGYSRDGRISRHWDARILEVHRYYSERFINSVRRHPDTVVKIWQRDRITIYRVHAS